jgi:hypothetical protein
MIFDKKWRTMRRLWREFLHSEVIYMKEYTEPQNKLYVGGDAPLVVGPGRVEILYFKTSGEEATH